MSPLPKSTHIQATNVLICSLILALLSIGQAGCKSPLQSCRCDVKTAALVDEPEVPVIAIYRVTAGMRARITPEEREPQIILAAWNDGGIVWSDDEIRGGRPYHEGHIAPHRLSSFFKELTARGVSAERLERRSYFGPDSDYLAIALCSGRYSLDLQSWHELFETRPNTVATARAISPLTDKSRQQVLAEQPEDYRRFREFWTFIRTAARELVPDAEQPAPELHFERRSYKPD